MICPRDDRPRKGLIGRKVLIGPLIRLRAGLDPGLEILQASCRLHVPLQRGPEECLTALGASNFGDLDQGIRLHVDPLLAALLSMMTGELARPVELPTPLTGDF